MKSAKAGTLSGCLVWIILVFIILTCIGPIAAMVGGFSSSSDFAVKITGPMVCPENTTPHVNTYDTTMIDDFGNSQPATGFELQCLDANGKNIKTDPVLYSFIWIGIVGLAGFILTGILAFVLAAPAGILIGRLFNRNKEDQPLNIEPK